MMFYVTESTLCLYYPTTWINPSVFEGLGWIISQICILSNSKIFHKSDSRSDIQLNLTEDCVLISYNVF